MSRKVKSQNMVGKIVNMYNNLYQSEDPMKENANFWMELFLLKVNTSALHTCILKYHEANLAVATECNHRFFRNAVNFLSKDSNPRRKAHALTALSVLVRGICDFVRLDKCPENIIADTLVSRDDGKSYFETLIDQINRLLHEVVRAEEEPEATINMALASLAQKFIIAVASAYSDMDQNLLLEHFMNHSVFDSHIDVLACTSLPLALRHQAVMVLMLLLQFRKKGGNNLYLVRFSILDDALALNGYARVVENRLMEFSEIYRKKTKEVDTGFFSSLSTMVGQLFVGDEAQAGPVRCNDALLFAVYEAVHLNRNFITTLTMCQPIGGVEELQERESQRSRKYSFGIEPKSVNTSNSLNGVTQSSNLLITLIQYTSIILQDFRKPGKLESTRLCVIILCSIAEDEYANFIMHDLNMNFRVPIHKMPMRHRKQTQDVDSPSQPLACALIELVIEFLTSHLMKSFPFDLYIRSVGIVQRLLCYQKKCRTQLPYDWRRLWFALFRVLRFMVSAESSLIPRFNIFHLCSRIVGILNLFLTYGDAILDSPRTYDLLYYEIIRENELFDSLHSIALRYSSMPSSPLSSSEDSSIPPIAKMKPSVEVDVVDPRRLKESALRLTHLMFNIRAVVRHFLPRVEAWAAEQGLSHYPVAEEQILQVVRSYYDSLQLRLQAGNDQFDRCQENPAEARFLQGMFRSVISDTRDIASLENLHSDCQRVSDFDHVVSNIS